MILAPYPLGGPEAVPAAVSHCANADRKLAACLKFFLCSNRLEGEPNRGSQDHITRRSAPQRTNDDAAFPVRIMLVAPSSGFGLAMEEMYRWLKDRTGRHGYAVHSGGRGGVRERSLDRMAVYFKDLQIAVDFLSAFPDLVLADGTVASWYTAPGLNNPATVKS